MGPNTQDKAERFTAATGHHLEDVMATCHTLGIAGEAASKIVQHPLVLLTALGENMVWYLAIAYSAVSSCLSAMLTHSGIRSSSVPSLTSLGVCPGDGQRQGDKGHAQ